MEKVDEKTIAAIFRRLRRTPAAIQRRSVERAKKEQERVRLANMRGSEAPAGAEKTKRFGGTGNREGTW